MIFQTSGRSAAALSVLSLLPMQGCFVALDDSDSSSHHFPDSSNLNSASDDVDFNRPCASSEQWQSETGGAGLSPGTKPCYASPLMTYSWRSSCPFASCVNVPIFVHYMLTQNMGEANVVYVEAFDNPHFRGLPVNSARLGDFNATKPGGFARADLYLQPGEYYVRAYIANDDDNVAPASYESMKLVSDRPVGVYGALSSEHSLMVKPRQIEQNPAPLDVYLDQMFKKNVADAPTNANVRLKLKFADVSKIQAGRKIYIELHSDADLAKKPAARLEMASESFLIEGHKGEAEYVASNLPAGQYIMFAYADNNGNGFYDTEEPSDTYSHNGVANFVSVEDNRTATVELNLQTAASAQTPAQPTSPSPAPQPQASSTPSSSTTAAR